MKKLFIIIFSAFSLVAEAQQKKVAVYVTGDEVEAKVLGSRLQTDIAKSGKYTVIERNAIFLAELKKEQNYQRTGAVDDEELSRLGKQFGVSLICVADIFSAFGESYVSARLIDVVSAEVTHSASANGNLQDYQNMKNISSSIVNDLLAQIDEKSNRKKVAVYVAQSQSKEIGRVLGDKLVTGFTLSGQYTAVERTNSFLSQLNKEQKYQRTGEVDDNDISRLGKQFGVQYVCVAEVSDYYGDQKYISAKLIDVETAELVNAYDIGGRMDNMSNCLLVANEIATNLSKGTFKEQAEEIRIRTEQEEIARKKAEYEAYAKKIAVLDIYDRDDQLSSSLKDLLRYHLTKAISETEGYMAYSNKDIDEILGEEFYNYGLISDKKYQQIYQLTGAHSFLFIECNLINESLINVSVKLLQNNGKHVVFSLEKKMGTSSEDILAGCQLIINTILD